MDLIGDIVEHEPAAPEPPAAPAPAKPPPTPQSPQTSHPAQISTSSRPAGFPVAAKRQPSQWRARLQKKGLASMSDSVRSDRAARRGVLTDSSTGFKKFADPKEKKLNYDGLSEHEQIHLENIEILSKMSDHEREEAKQELIDNLDPKVLQMLLSRSEKKYGQGPQPTANSHESRSDSFKSSAIDSDGESTVSSPNLKPALRKDSSSSASSDKKVRFNSEATVKYLEKDTTSKKSRSPKTIPVQQAEEEWEDIEYLDEMAPSVEDAQKLSDTNNSEKIASSSVHFPAAPKDLPSLEKLDINDPNFNEKLHEKFFPDLPKDPKSLEWMSPAPQTPSTIAYDSVSQLRFDFKGDLITSENVKSYENSTELHHHSQNPEIPGYTLPELAHYLRSTFPGQRCIALRSLGRILFKLAQAQFKVVSVDDEEAEQEVQLVEFELNCWKLVMDLKIMDVITECASDSQRNLSVKNYAIEALWLWKQGGGDEKLKMARDQLIKLEQHEQTF